MTRAGLAGLAAVLIVALWASQAWAQTADGRSAIGRGDYPAARAALLPAAESGDAEAQYLIGLTYLHGTGPLQNFDQSAVWFRRAAEQGHATAQLALGLQYEQGLGVKRSAAEAYAWLRKAALAGDPTALSYFSTRGGSGGQ